MKKVFVLVFLTFWVFSGCASSNGFVKKGVGVGDFLRFTPDVLSLRLLLEVAEIPLIFLRLFWGVCWILGR